MKSKLFLLSIIFALAVSSCGCAEETALCKELDAIKTAIMEVEKETPLDSVGSVKNIDGCPVIALLWNGEPYVTDEMITTSDRYATTAFAIDSSFKYIKVEVFASDVSNEEHLVSITYGKRDNGDLYRVSADGESCFTYVNTKHLTRMQELLSNKQDIILAKCNFMNGREYEVSFFLKSETAFVTEQEYYDALMIASVDVATVFFNYFSHAPNVTVFATSEIGESKIHCTYHKLYTDRFFRIVEEGGEFVDFPTTSQEITFFDFRWNTQGYEIGRFFEKENWLFSDNDYGEIRGPVEEKNDYDTYSDAPAVSFGDGIVIPVVSSANVRAAYGSLIVDPQCSEKVAGHDVLQFDMMYMLSDDILNDILYEIVIHIKPSVWMSIDEQFADLSRKLTALYGEPYAHREEGLRNTECNVWLGANSTAVYLQKNVDLQSGSSNLSIHYGLTTSGSIFSAIDNDAALKQQIFREEALNEIANDFSGL